MVGRVLVRPTAKRTQHNRIVALQKEIRRGGGGRGGRKDRGGRDDRGGRKERRTGEEREGCYTFSIAQ